MITWGSLHIVHLLSVSLDFRYPRLRVQMKHFLQRHSTTISPA